VSDGSTDAQTSLVRGIQSIIHGFELVRMPERRERNFAGSPGIQRRPCQNGRLEVRHLSQPGCRRLLRRRVFEFLLGKFADNLRLGVAGTPIGKIISIHYRFTSIEMCLTMPVVQRECFEEIGGFVPRKIGAFDLVP